MRYIGRQQSDLTCMLISKTTSIKAIATHIRDEAAAGMKRANAVFAETEVEPPY